MKEELEIPHRSASMTNILMLARVLDAGGIERDVSKFARHLSSRGFQPHVGCFNPGGMRWDEIAAAGIPTVAIPVKSFRSRSAFDGARILRRYIREHQIRLIHAFDVPADMYAVPLARLWGISVLSSQLGHRNLSNLQARVVMTFIDRMASGVFVNCEAVATHLQRDWKVAERLIHVCYNGYEPEEFHPEGRGRPEMLKEASIVVGTVALLRPEKNLGLLVEAFARLLQVDRKARLLLVGSGPVRPDLEKRMCELQIRDACIFQDTVARPADWMRAMDVFVLPSTTEGFSNSLLEAMACGCCPVASRVGGTPELVVDEEHGILFESGNVAELSAALIELARDPAKRKAMAGKAAAFVRQQLTMEHAAARLAGIYKTVLGQPVDAAHGEEFVPLRSRERETAVEAEIPLAVAD